MLINYIRARIGLSPLHRSFEGSNPVFAYTAEGVTGIEGTAVFFINTRGETLWIVSDSFALQQPGTRYPVQWAKWVLWRFFSASPARLPALMIAVCLLLLSGAIAASLPANANPYGEWAVWLLPNIATAFVWAMNLALALAALAVVVAFTARPVAEHIVDAVRKAKAKEGDSLMLEAGTDISIAPDILITFESVDEAPDNFFARVADVRRTFGAEKYIIVLPYKSDDMVICHPADVSESEVTEVHDVRSAFTPGAMPAERETWNEYIYFIERAAPALKKMCFGLRAKKQGAMAALAASRQSYCLIFALLLASISPAMGQSKTARLTAYLAERATFIVPEQGQLFKASFQLAPVSRTGDGKKNLLELLQSGTAFTDADNLGPLVAVFVGGKMLSPDQAVVREKTATASADPVSALPIGAARPSKSLWESIPDSARLTDFERSGDKFFRASGKEVKSRWSIIMRMFWKWGVPLIFAVGVLFWWVAKVAFGEMKQSSASPFVFIWPLAVWGHGARYGVFICVSLIALVSIVDSLVIDLIQSDTLWEWAFLTVIKAGVAYWIARWVVPDPPSVFNAARGQGGIQPALGTGY